MWSLIRQEHKEWSSVGQLPSTLLLRLAAPTPPSPLAVIRCRAPRVLTDDFTSASGLLDSSPTGFHYIVHLREINNVLRSQR